MSASYTIRTSITFIEPDSETSSPHHWLIRAEFAPQGANGTNPSRTAGTILTQAFSPLELTTVLAALGRGDLIPTTESVAEFIARGGSITHCPTAFLQGDHRQNTRRVPLPQVASAPKVKCQLSPSELAALDLTSLLGA